MQQVCRCKHGQTLLMSRARSFAKLSARLSLPQIKQTRARTERCQSFSAASLATAEHVQAEPTFVPRTEGITDGKWDQQDEAAVNAALQDAQKVVRKRSAAQPGMCCSLFHHKPWLCLTALTTLIFKMYRKCDPRKFGVYLITIARPNA